MVMGRMIMLARAMVDFCCASASLVRMAMRTRQRVGGMYHRVRYMFRIDFSFCMFGP